MNMPWRGTTPEISAEVESMYETPGGAQEKVNSASKKLDDRLQYFINQSGNSVAEIVDARFPANGVPFENVRARLNDLDLELDKRSINVQKFGAMGNGVKDDTLAIQLAINYAALIKGMVFIPAGNYIVSSVLLKNGLVGFIGQGAKLTAKTASARVIDTTTDNMDLSQQVNNCIIKGIEIDLKGLASIGIYLYGCDNQVTECKIYGAKSNSQLVRVTYDSHRNIISKNNLVSLIDEPFGTYTDMSCIIIEGKQFNNEAGLDVGNQAVSGTNTSYDNHIRDNFCVGGTHGIGLRQAERTIIYGNSISKGSHRGIVLSPYACNNSIVGNFFFENGSSSVHMAYGSSNNFVSNNRISNLLDPAIFNFIGEGEIQSYTYAKNNTISNNDITTTKRYGIYSGTCSDGVVIDSNVVRGGKRACIGFESDWSPLPLPTGAIHGRNAYGIPSNPSWTSWDNGNGFNNVAITNNKLYPRTDDNTRTGIYVAQMMNSTLNNVTISGNTVYGVQDFGTDIYIYVNDPNKFTNAVIVNNQILPDQPLRFVLYNENTKLMQYTGNSWQNQYIAVNAARIDANGLIDISRYDNLYVTVSDVTIKGFKGVTVQGRKITLRLSQRVTLTYSVSGLHLKNLTNVTTPDAYSDNHIIEFAYIGANWIETYRNF